MKKTNYNIVQVSGAGITLGVVLLTYVKDSYGYYIGGLLILLSSLLLSNVGRK